MLTPDFLFYAVQTRAFIEAMCLKVQGALYPAVRPNDISSFRLPPFTLSHQRRIVAKIEELFTELDAGEESLRRARRLLGVYRQSLLKQAFEGKLTAPWRKQTPHLLESAASLLERIQAERQARSEQQLTEWEADRKNGKKLPKPTKPKPLAPFNQSELPDRTVVPEGWLVLQFGELCSVVRNGISHKPTGAAGYKISRISAVRPMFFDYEDYRFISCSDEMAAEYALQSGDLVFTRYNGARRYVGACAHFTGKEIRLYPDKLIRTRPDLPSLDPDFLKFGLNSGLSRAWLKPRSELPLVNQEYREVTSKPCQLPSAPSPSNRRSSACLTSSSR